MSARVPVCSLYVAPANTTIRFNWRISFQGAGDVRAPGITVLVTGIGFAAMGILRAILHRGPGPAGSLRGFTSIEWAYQFFVVGSAPSAVPEV